MAQLPAHVQEHIYSVGIVDYFAGRGPLPEGCKLYETRAAARTASGIATWAAARGHAWEDARDGAWDAAEAAARTAAWAAAWAAVTCPHSTYSDAVPDDSTVQLHHELSSSSLDALTGQGVRQSVGGH
mgnify:CR=1 FL=1|jgi:hypothetical protein